MLQRQMVETRMSTGRTVSVNTAESPLSWLRARKLIDARQFEAGERLRADYERASVGPSVTMRWDMSPQAKGRRGAPDGLYPTNCTAVGQAALRLGSIANGSRSRRHIVAYRLRGRDIANCRKGVGLAHTVRARRAHIGARQAGRCLWAGLSTCGQAGCRHGAVSSSMKRTLALKVAIVKGLHKRSVRSSRPPSIPAAAA